MAGLVPAISIGKALHCPLYRDRRVKPGDDDREASAVGWVRRLTRHSLTLRRTSGAVTHRLTLTHCHRAHPCEVRRVGVGAESRTLDAWAKSCTRRANEH